MNRHLLVWTFLVLLFTSTSNLLATETLVVNEEKSRFEMVNTTGRLQLAITNRTNVALKSHITLSFITPSDVVVKTMVSDEVLKPGDNEINFQSPQFLAGLKDADRYELPWFRLRYRLDLPSGEETHGIVPLSSLMPNTFQLQLGLLRHPRPGEPWVVHVFAQNPSDRTPVELVLLDVELTISPLDDSKDRIVTLSGRTDAHGISTFRFPIPKDISNSDLSVKVKGRRGNEIRSVEDTVLLLLREEVQVTTDKPIYQPGQSLKIRALAFDELGNALRGERLQLEIKDGDYSTVFKSDLNASRFGEAHTEWAVPENARLGRYLIVVNAENNRFSGTAEVEVRRYDLPNFSVTVKPDRSYYLWDQSAVVEIQARYLFGQPVSHSRVRVVDDSQTDEVSAVSLAEGESDIEGRFTATIDFRKKRQGLKAQEYPSEYVVLTAYATDPSTGRTEKRKFGLSFNREAIHISLRTPHTLTSGLPVAIFVAAQYADGRPAECDVEVIPVNANGDPLPLAVRSVHTNRFGIALLQENSWVPKGTDETQRLGLMLKAEDVAGNSGTSQGQLRFEEDATWVSTAKIRYSSGEPLSIQIQSSHRSGPVIVDVLHDRSLLSTNIVYLAEGKGEVTVQTSERFWGQVQISAHYVGETTDDSNGDKRNVEFPNNRGLQIELQPTRDVYAPGDEAALSLRVRSRQKNPVEGLIGISIVDRAVEERQRADFSAYPYSTDSGDGYRTVTRSDLAIADRTVPLPEDLRLAAEYLFNSEETSANQRQFIQSTDGSPEYIFRAHIESRVAPLKTALDARFQRDRNFPTNDASLKTLLAEDGLNADEFHDPWDNRFQFRFEANRNQSKMLGISAGPDKAMGTADDFTAIDWGWPYFQLRGEILKRAVRQYQDSSLVFVRDVPTLRKALQQAGEDLDQWLDPWGRAYRYEFAVSGSNYFIIMTTSGLDGVFGTEEKYSTDDGQVLNTSFDYAFAIRRDLQDAVGRFYRETGSYPETESQVQQAIRAANISDSQLTDPWGHRYYVVVQDVFDYRDNIIRNLVGDNLTYAEYLELQSSASGILPVTAEVRMTKFRSAGPDGIEGNSDDFDLFRLSRTLAQQSASDPSAKPLANSPLLAKGEAAIEGVVTDRTSALISGVTIRAFQLDVEILRTSTDSSGAYAAAPLKPGYYDVLFEFPGFRRFVIRDVPVQDRAMQLNVVMTVAEPGSTVMAESSASIGEELTLNRLFDFEIGRGSGSFALLSGKGPTPIPTATVSPSAMPSLSSTPRLRQFFPETLVWQPSLETDRKGNAELRFKLADNITQWNINAIASTTDGRFGATSANIISWRPFFVEHDPPKSLTVGDEIGLPIVMRSYLDRDQALTVSLKPEPWFSVTGPTQRTTSVKAGESTREVFGFKAVAPIKDGKQRITAAGAEVSDAIEKPVSVHPDGREVVQSQSRLLQGSSVFEMNLPASTLNNTVHAELKLYPNLLSQLTDAMENILRRPYGCAEQQISSAYPGLLLMQHQKEFGGVSSAVQEKAKRNLAEGYARLLGFQSEGGGFSYWGSGPSDIAVTAYAVEFLQGAKPFIAVDESVLKKAAVWLADRQKEDGSWSRSLASAAQRDRADVLTLTSYVLRVLSNPEIGKLLTVPANSSQQQKRDTVGDAIRFVRDNSEQWGEPGSLASVALAALNIGDRETAARVSARLEQLSHREGDSAYWDLQTNTLFFGWGLPGRVESTALSVRALAAGNAAGSHSDKTQALIDQGLQFLLRNKDRYGVWYSTQSTIRVLETIEHFIGKPVGDAHSKGRVEIWVNGMRLDSFFDTSSKSVAPVTIDISRYAKVGGNRIELRGPVSSVATVQLVESHYVPWADSPAAVEPALHLGVSFDKTAAKSGDEITATVKVERVGFRGYGMMLAEIGLPPGVDVDRASLDRAVADAGAELFRYDVLPDRIVAYVWPKAGGSQFQFKFRARYGMNAQTPASFLYDYYNPEAQAVLLPVRFQID